MGRTDFRCQGKGLYHKLSHDFSLKLLLSSQVYISTYSVKCREANLLLFLPLIWTSSVANVTSRRHLKSCVKYPDRDVLGKSAEDGQSQVVPRLDGGVAERFSGRRR